MNDEFFMTLQHQLKMTTLLRNLVIILLVTTGCGRDKDVRLEKSEKKLYTKLTNVYTGVDFTNTLTETIDNNGLLYEYYYSGGGLAVGDFNNDGLKDLFFVSTLYENKLFLNQGDLKFIDVSNFTGIIRNEKFSGGVTTVDINNDGWLDIYVSNSGKFQEEDKRRNELFINQGVKGKYKIPVFKEESEKYGLDFTDCSTQATFFDYDKDGDLDMFLLNHHPNSYSTNDLKDLLNTDGGVSKDRLLRNDRGKFVDVSREAGIVNNALGYGLGVSIGDLNNDTWPDIYVSNDYNGKDYLYINRQDGTFSERIDKATNHISFFSMGNDIGDINNDGWMDVLTLDMVGNSSYDIKTSMSGMNPESFYENVDAGLHYQYMYNTLQLNTGYIQEDSTPTFSEIAQFSGVSNTDWSWAPLFFDMDNDGYKDIFISNGIKRDFRNNDFINYLRKTQDSIHRIKRMDKIKYIRDALKYMPPRKKENYFFRNNGELQFSKMNEAWGDGTMTCSNGAIYADLDNDGDLEVVVNNTDDPVFILKNNAIELGLGHYLTVKMHGPKHNLDGIGTKVIVKTKENEQVQELYLSRGFMSSVSRELHFGLGQEKQADIEVIWPDNKRQELKAVKVDQLVTLDYKKAKFSSQKTKKTSELFKYYQQPVINFEHKENDFNDFKRESLLPHKMSQEGPSLAVADVNGDSCDDIYIGGALGQAGALYVQQDDGSFAKSNIMLWEGEKKYEDVAAEFFDADNDGDMDLYVVSGGNEYLLGNVLLNDRLYINDGIGNYSLVTNVLPSLSFSGSCVKVADYDLDGDLDLFVGGRQVPGKYPDPASSYILQNNSQGDKLDFKDVTESVSDVFKEIGMVTDAIWTDLDKDGYYDLVVVGEWMPIRILMNQKGSGFKDFTEIYGLEKYTGWWYSIAAGDFDKDGDMDLVAGNLGLNYKYKASYEKPFEVFADDFDNTGTKDIVLSYYDNDKLVPLRGRECSSNQMPFIKEKFPTYDAFGKASIEDIFDREQLENSRHFEATTFATVLLENDDGKFHVRNMPNLAQLTSVNSILVEDLDNDDNLDFILAGNLYGSEVETPRSDAGYGLYLKGDGKGSFIPIPSGESGLMVKGEVKHIKRIKVKEKEAVVFALNNGPVKVVQLR